MDRSRSSVSLFNELNYFMVEKEYLNSLRHKQSIDYSRKCANFYERISTEIEGYYHIIYSLPEKLKEAIETAIPKQNNQFQKFKSFLKQFFEIFTLLSHFQINQLSKGRSSLTQNRESSFENFIQAIDKYRALQEEFEQDRTNYKTVCLNIENKFKEFMSIFNKIEENFNAKLIKNELAVIKEGLAKKQKLQQVINEKAQGVAANSRIFQKQLMFHRQKLVSYKYSYIQKISRFCANAKQSLMEIMTFMNDLITQSRQAFTVNKKDINTGYDIGNIKDIGEYIKVSTKEHQEMTDKYLAIIQALIHIFTEISRQIRQEKGRQAEIIEQMNKYFQYNQCNITEVLNTMDLYTVFLKYLSQLGDRLIYSENTMRLLQKNVNKQKQITLTIFKRNSSSGKLPGSPTSHQRSSSNPRQRQNQKNYINSLFEQMSPIYINNIICKIFHDFQETVAKISDKFLMNRPVKKYTNNSMSMSYIRTQYSDPDRRPFKCDIWLWKEWRRQICKEFIDFMQIKTVLGQMDKYIEKYNADDKQLQKLNCVFANKKLKGVLKLKTHGLTFQSLNNSHQYFIPLFKIDSIDMQLNIMSKAVMIETVHGNLVFTDENVKDIKKFYVSVQKALDFFNQNNDEGKETKEAVVISGEEIEFIKERRAKIESELEKESDYQQFNTVLLENVTINDTYRVVFSDNKITIKGKEYACFIDSMMKKFNNYNQKYQSFEPQGPEFYTGINGINFQNCPIFSERVIQYDHTLPKLPFIPESCHNTQTVRVYWVSHQQFHVTQKNLTSGAPYTQNFYLSMLYKVNKVAEDVQIRLFVKVNIVQDFSLKKMVVAKALEEAKWGSSLLVEEVKKCMLGYKRKQGKDGARQQNLEQSNLSDKTIVKNYKTKIKQLEGRNKMLMYILGAVLILNILIQLFF